MTLNEFKAWFEGFSSMIDGALTEQHLELIKWRIKEKLEMVKPAVISETKTIDLPLPTFPIRPEVLWCGGGSIPPHNYFNRG